MLADCLDIKLVLIGNSGAGKSSIALRLLTDTFNPDSETTVGGAYMSKIFHHRGYTLKFNIWDTAGQERFQKLTRMYYQDANVAILVYDITDPASFEGLKKWYFELLDNGPPDLVKVIAANKEDLFESELVPFEAAKDFAVQIGASLRKTSAKTSAGVQQLFELIADQIFQLRKPQGLRKRTDTVYLSSISVKKPSKRCC